jgi:hypothetical protein
MRSELEGQQCNRKSFTAGQTAWIVLAALSLVAAGCGSAQDPNRLPVFPAAGKISFKGAVPDGAYVALHSKTKVKAPNGQEVIPTAQVKPDGTFNLSSYAAADGAPAGDYKLTIEWHKTIKPVGGDPTLGPNLLPQQYSKADSSPVEVVIATGPNELKPIVLK